MYKKTNKTNTHAKEEEIKQKLIKILSKDFDVIEEQFGVSFYGKKVRPDLAIKIKGRDELFLIEIKDDTTENFSLAHLLRQAITYKFSKFKGQIPTVVFVTTTKMLNGTFDFNQQNFGEFLLSQRLGVGLMMYNDREPKYISMKMGERKRHEHYKYYFELDDSELNFTEFNITVGTKAKSNILRTRINYKKESYIEKTFKGVIVDFINYCNDNGHLMILDYSSLVNHIESVTNKKIEKINYFLDKVFKSLDLDFSYDYSRSYELREFILVRREEIINSVIHWDKGVISQKKEGLNELKVLYIK